MCKDSGTTPATNNQVQNNAPWSGALPYINQGLSGSQSLYESGGPQYYPGQTYAGTNPALDSGLDQLNGIQSMFAPTQQAAQGAIGGAINDGQNVANQSQGILGAAQGIGADAQGIGDRAANIGNSTAQNDPAYSFFQGLTNGNSNAPGMSTLQDYANGKYLSADNPYFKQMSDTIKAQVQPGIQAQFANAGRGVSGLAGRAVGEGLGDSIGSLAYQNYQQGLGQQQNAAQSLAGYGVTGGQNLSSIYNQNTQNRLNAGNLGLGAGNLGISAGNLGLGAGNQALAGGNLALQGAQLAPAIQNMGINAGNASLLAGTTAQGIQQGALTDAQNRYNYNQNLPQQNLQNYIRNITGQVQGTGSTTSSGTAAPAQASFWNQLLGGGLAAASFFQ